MTDVHPRISANSLCLGDVGLDVLADRWRDLAPRRIGLVSDQLLDGDFDHLRRIIANGSYVVETIAHVFTDSLTPDPDGWVRPRAQLSRLITLAAQIGARSIYMLSGNRGGMAWEPAAAAFAAALAPCIRQAHDAGIALAVEPAMPLIAGVHIAHTLRDATTLAEIADIGLCIDVFACWTEAGLDALLDRAAPLARVVQISDYVPTDRALPCRAVPGDGVIPLAPIIRRLIDNGYVGGFDLELIGPRIEQEGHVAATRRAMLALGRILADCGA